MLDTLKIQNFKAIKNLEISELGQINLITGKNNTCKTSVLEAISILVSGGEWQWILELLNDRDETIYWKEGQYAGKIDFIETLKSLFFERKIDFFSKENNIFIGNNEIFIDIFLSYAKNRFYQVGNKTESEIIRVENKEDTDIQFTLLNMEGKDNSIWYFLYKDITARMNERLLSDNFAYQFVSSNTLYSSKNAKLWDNIVLTAKEEFVVNAMKIIDKRIDKLVFVGDETGKIGRVTKVKMVGSDERVPLKSMGDGISRILNIALALVNAENGYLFIDEFENGLHYSAQTQLWELIFYLSKKLNVQVFATTHSNDSVFSFSYMANKEENKKLGKLIKLTRNDDTIKAVEFSSEDLRIANENDINLR